MFFLAVASACRHSGGPPTSRVCKIGSCSFSPQQSKLPESFLPKGEEVRLVPGGRMGVSLL